MNAVIYARYSSKGQTEQSIEGQLHDNYDYAEREGLTVIGEYIDRAQTGRNDNRDNFQRMILDAQKKQFEVIIVWKLDRFARNRYDSAIYKAKLKKCGVKVLSAKENITDNPEGIILEGMLEAMAEYYSANLSVNVKRGQRETVAKGRYVGGNVPYGYNLVDGKLVADEKTAPIIKYVFEEYAKGTTKKQIIDTLKARGVKSPYGRPLTLNSFANALRSRIYIGEYYWKGELVEGCAEPIIDLDTFERVQTQLSLHKYTPAQSHTASPYLLQGKIFCGHCGSAMIGESGHSKTGAVYQYYTCSKRKKQHDCKKKNERKHLIEEYVVQQTISYVLRPENITEIAKQVSKQYKQDFGTNAQEDTLRQINKIESDIEKLIDALIDAPKSAHKRIYDRIDLLEQTKSDLQNELTKLKIAAAVPINESSIAAFIRQFIDGSALLSSNDSADSSLPTSTTTPEYRERIINTFVNRIYLYDDRIEIYYNTTPSTQTTTTPPKSSTPNELALPSQSTSEPKLIFIRNIFGCIFKWDRKKTTSI